MNCYNHADRAAISFCRACGRGLCPFCQRIAEGTVFCPEHAPVTTQGGYGAPGSTGGPGTSSGSTGGPNPYTQSPYAAPVGASASLQASPLLAFILGFIPGVGAIYNGQYIKGLIHAGVFGLLVTLINGSGGRGIQPLFGIMITAFVFYMPFEAYHTAKHKLAGMPVEEWSSLSRGPFPMSTGRTPVGPIILIGVGVLFLLDTLNLIEFDQIGRFWPVILIAIGASMLYSRVAPGRGPTIPPPGTYGAGPGAPPPPAGGTGYQAPPSYSPPAPSYPASEPTVRVYPPAPTSGTELMETGRD